MEEKTNRPELPSDPSQWKRKVLEFRVSYFVLTLVFSTIAYFVLKQELDLIQINGVTTTFFIGMLMLLVGVGFLLPPLQKNERIKEVMKRNPERYFPSGDSAPWWGWILGLVAIAGIIFVGYHGPRQRESAKN